MHIAASKPVALSDRLMRPTVVLGVRWMRSDFDEGPGMYAVIDCADPDCAGKAPCPENTLERCTDGADNDVADISGAVVTLNVTGAGNMIGAGSADFLEVDAATRLDAATNNGLIALKNVSGNLPLGTINAGTNFIFGPNGSLISPSGSTIVLNSGGRPFSSPKTQPAPWM